MASSTWTLLSRTAIHYIGKHNKVLFLWIVSNRITCSTSAISLSFALPRGLASPDRPRATLSLWNGGFSSGRLTSTWFFDGLCVADCFWSAKMDKWPATATSQGRHMWDFFRARTVLDWSSIWGWHFILHLSYSCWQTNVVCKIDKGTPSWLHWFQVWTIGGISSTSTLHFLCKSCYGRLL